MKTAMKTKMAAGLALVGAFGFGAATLPAAEMTLTGAVSDSHCGLKHRMANAEACTAGCVGQGADYTLVVDNTKVYTLKADTAQKTELAKLGGKMAMITGDVEGTTITVASVKMAAK